MPADTATLAEALAEAIIKRGQINSSGEPLFFDRFRLKLTIEQVLEEWERTHAIQV